MEHKNGGIIIETERCILAKIKIDDFEDVKKIYVNDLVRRYLGGVIPEEHTRTKFIETLNRSQIESHFWVVRLKMNNQFIGLISLDKHVDGGIEVSYELLPTWWRAGYATEILSQVIDFAFNDLEISRVLAETQTANASSCRLLERIGMKLERKVQRFGAEQAIYSIEKADSTVPRL
ncbi:GNAT family N-acetyltransferase [Bacillus sp. FJAT-26390]|uniref:GNAT family N-acetyltransferase n=1 Tax=Bacillus sp. FJAT-26390 TaxID=1743142 RepID=UPI00210053FD|nr:GNAT family N-acetyltransferase [Bacillus sp. FJAT-26390]